jgi:hypothetical protein
MYDIERYWREQTRGRLTDHVSTGRTLQIEASPAAPVPTSLFHTQNPDVRSTNNLVLNPRLHFQQCSRSLRKSAFPSRPRATLSLLCIQSLSQPTASSKQKVNAQLIRCNYFDHLLTHRRYQREEPSIWRSATSRS